MKDINSPAASFSAEDAKLEKLDGFPTQVLIIDFAG